MTGEPENPWPLRLAWPVVIAATALPILRADIPPGADMINHLARAHIFRHANVDPDLTRFYEPVWPLLPNLAFDIAMVPLLMVFDTYTAGKVFLVFSIFLLFAGVAALRRAVHGQAGWAPLLVAVIAYSPLVAIGLTNFLFGCGLLMLALALFLRTEAWSWTARLALWSAAAIGLFLTHAMIAAAYGLIIAAIRGASHVFAGRRFSMEDLPIAGQFLVPGILWLMVKAPTHGTDTLFGPLHARLEAVIAPVLYFQDWEVPLAACLGVLIIWLTLTRRLTVAPVLRVPLAVMMLASLVMPMQLLGVWLTHVRLPIIAALLFLAGVRIDIRARALRLGVIAALVIIAALRLIKVDAAIASCDGHRKEITEAIADLPRGVRILPVMEPGADTGACLFSNYWHMPALAVIERSALYPQMFVQMQPLKLAPAFRHLSQPQQRPAYPGELVPNPGAAPSWSQKISTSWRREFDVLFWLHPGTQPRGVPDGITRLRDGTFFTVFVTGPIAPPVVPAPPR